MIRTLMVVAALVLSFSAQAQQLKVATGSQKGTYATMFREMGENCAASGLVLIDQTTSGSAENVNLLVGNQVNAAFVQTDVLFLRAMNEDLSSVKTLIALHPEEVHIVSLAQSKLMEGGIGGTSFRAKPVIFNSFVDLANRRIGAVGGSYVTAQVMLLQGGVPFQAIEFPTNDALLAAIQTGQVEAGLFVGGQPLPALAALGKEYKLLPIPEAAIARLKAVYRPARLNYTKMGASGVATVATDALFVTREYKTAKMIDGLMKLRQCVLGNIDELKETTGTHPKWQAVDPANKGKWAWYDLKPIPATKK